MKDATALRLALLVLLTSCTTTAPTPPPAPRPEPPPPAPRPTWGEVGLAGLATEFGSVTPMPDGTWLLIGGYIQDDASPEPYAITDVRRFDPVDGTMRALAPLPERRAFHSAHLLPDGRVGVVGGLTRPPGERFDFTPRTYVYDPKANTWAPGPDQHAPRLFSGNLTLPDGRILLIGGTSSPLHSGGLPPTAEIVDFAHATVTSFPIPEPRYQHTATLLPDGQVFVAGGRTPSGPITTATTYEPSATTWTLSLKELRVRPGPSMAKARARHAAVLLEDGSVLVSGGVTVTPGGKRALKGLERYAQGSWSESACALPDGRLDHVLVATPEGSVWVLGGSGLTEPRLDVWAWRPDTSACPEDRGALGVPRPKGLWAGSARDGRVLVVGGSRVSGVIEAQ